MEVKTTMIDVFHIPGLQRRTLTQPGKKIEKMEKQNLKRQTSIKSAIENILMGLTTD